MAKLVALEWDAAEARVAVARTGRGGEVIVEQAFAIHLATRGADPNTEDDASIGRKLAAELSRRNIGRTDAVVALGRANIELRRLQLPPTPDDELPDMVRFQAMRQFSTIGEQWPIDFIPLSRSETNVDVLAAAIAPAVVENVQSVCAGAELTPRNLVLRPFAAASLLKRARPEDSRCRLVVDVLSSDADLFVIADDKVAFVRTVRLPHTEGITPILITAMVGEVRRTIAAAQSQLGGQRIEAITVCGDPTRFPELQSALEAQLPLPMDFFNPFSAVTLAPELQRAIPEFPGRYTPLLGMLLDSATGSPHTIDFLHPRRRPEPKNNRQRVLIWTTVAVAACSLLAIGVKFQFDRMDRENAALRETLASLQTGTEAAQRKRAELDLVESFLAGDVPWLLDLERLSDKLPPAREAIVTEFTARWLDSRIPGESGEGQVTLKGLVRSSDQVAEMERSLRGEDHYRVDGKGYTPNLRGGNYNWYFDETLRLNAQRSRETEETETPASTPESEKTTQVQPQPGAEVPSSSPTAGTVTGRQSS